MPIQSHCMHMPLCVAAYVCLQCLQALNTQHVATGADTALLSLARAASLPSLVAAPQMHAVVYELCSIANPHISLLQLLRAAARNKQPRVAGADEQPAPAPPAHVFACRFCGAKVAMQQEEVEFYGSKNLSLPKSCKPCRAARKQ